MSTGADLSLRNRAKFRARRLQQLCYSPVRSTNCSKDVRDPMSSRAWLRGAYPTSVDHDHGDDAVIDVVQHAVPADVEAP